MNFNLALIALADGARIRRKQWTHLFLVKHFYENESIVRVNLARWEVSRWQPLLQDLMENDWEIIE